MSQLQTVEVEFWFCIRLGLSFLWRCSVLGIISESALGLLTIMMVCLILSSGSIVLSMVECWQDEIARAIYMQLPSDFDRTFHGLDELYFYFEIIGIS